MIPTKNAGPIAGCWQADVPVEEYWNGGRSATVASEGRKAESYLLRAQQAAKETYHNSLVRPPLIPSRRYTVPVCTGSKNAVLQYQYILPLYTDCQVLLLQLAGEFRRLTRWCR